RGIGRGGTLFASGGSHRGSRRQSSHACAPREGVDHARITRGLPRRGGGVVDSGRFVPIHVDRPLTRFGTPPASAATLCAWMPPRSLHGDSGGPFATKSLRTSPGAGTAAPCANEEAKNRG